VATPTYDEIDSLAVSGGTIDGWHTDVPLLFVKMVVENTSGSSGTFNLWITAK